MKRVFHFLLLIGVLFLTGQASHAQDFNKGLRAFERGDYEVSFEEFLPLAKKGNAGAQNNLGVQYLDGLGVPQDFREAAKWTRLAAEQGLAVAQDNLGISYVEGRGVSQDFVEAVKWFTRAAEQGYEEAQHNLGWMYAVGQGVPHDYTEAAKWCRLAAGQGLSAAHKILGAMYREGLGVPQNYLHSHMWFNIAASLGLEGAREEREKIAKKMTSEEVSEAQKRARECVASNYKNC